MAHIVLHVFHVGIYLDALAWRIILRLINLEAVPIVGKDTNPKRFATFMRRVSSQL